MLAQVHENGQPQSWSACAANAAEQASQSISILGPVFRLKGQMGSTERSESSVSELASYTKEWLPLAVLQGRMFRYLCQHEVRQLQKIAAGHERCPNRRQAHASTSVQVLRTSSMAFCPSSACDVNRQYIGHAFTHPGEKLCLV
jgi:hypothetical protein